MDTDALLMILYVVAFIGFIALFGCIAYRDHEKNQ